MPGVADNSCPWFSCVARSGLASVPPGLEHRPQPLSSATANPTTTTARRGVADVAITETSSKIDTVIADSSGIDDTRAAGHTRTVTSANDSSSEETPSTRGGTASALATASSSSMAPQTVRPPLQGEKDKASMQAVEGDDDL